MLKQFVKKVTWFNHSILILHSDSAFPKSEHEFKVFHLHVILDMHPGGEDAYVCESYGIKSTQSEARKFVVVETNFSNACSFRCSVGKTTQVVFYFCGLYGTDRSFVRYVRAFLTRSG